MTSKEALERIAYCRLDLGYDDDYEPPQHCGYACVGLCYQDEIEVIKQDLDRLEKLEQIVSIIKEIGLTFQKDLRYYECDYGDWFKTPYAIENHPVSKEEWDLFKEIFWEKEGEKNND